MATSEEFMTYISDQLSDAGVITCRKMFGEYTIYCDTKVIGMVCDGQLFLKKTNAGFRLLKEVCEVPAYKGAKPSFLITSTDDREYLTKLVRASWSELPYPKPKKKKLKNNCDDAQYVCFCSKVTEEMIAEAISKGASSPEEVIEATGAMKNPDCKVNNPKGICCYNDIVRIIAEHFEKQSIEVK
ncbi:MAG: TfoX/Sxy family protein [Synergistaceae bacterium]|nr:TfoX/Sxy family protein [Synergistaceae bacterium]